ncbi:phytanoyl-CoA dioxygenase family protein [Sphaerisporangium sp. NPDC051011]|uniref:phytanoyl-CoA dioxygenase family protein n=1 Tax=Sphaerisporangium sp. NPDC051011 TaxID=3155792 RepID=UPI0034102EC9
MTISHDAALAQFTEQGFVLIKQAVPDAVVKTLDNAVLQLTDDRAPDLTHSSFNTNRALTQVRNAANIIAEYQLLFVCRDLMSVPYRILNGSIQVLGSEVLRREVYQRAHEPWHRDSGAFLERPYDEVNGPLHLKAQVFFTDTRPKDSGNLVLIPGSHRWPVDHKDDDYWESANDALAQGSVPDGALIVHAEPGDAVIFGNTMWHAVLPNLTQERRSAIIRFGQAWLRPYDHHWDPATAADHLSPENRLLLGYYSNEVNPVDLYKEATATHSWAAQ